MTDVGPGSPCYWYDAAEQVWLDAVFHCWLTAALPPTALLHCPRSGRCYLAKLNDVRFPVAVDPKDEP